MEMICVFVTHCQWIHLLSIPWIYKGLTKSKDVKQNITYIILQAVLSITQNIFDTYFNQIKI